MVSDLEGTTREFLASYPLMYEQDIYPELKHLRGFTRLRQWARSIGIELVSSKTSNGCYRLEVVEGKPVFQSKDDLKYYFFEYSYFTRLFNESLDAEVFCDVGGYHGFYSLVSQANQNYCFEVDPENLDELKANVNANSRENIEVLEKAVWSSNGQVNIDIGQGGESSVSNTGLTRESVTLDSFFDDKEDPDVIKIDVEGAEGHVLEGAEEILKDSKPKLFIEFHFDGRLQSFGHKFEEVKEFLESFGYNFSMEENRGREMHVVAE